MADGYTCRAMEAFLLSSINWLLATLALPEVGLSAIFVVALISATLLPLGSEPAVFAYLQLAPQMFWSAILVATAGNTIGGAISYWMGLAAEKAYERWKIKHEAEKLETDAREAQARAAELADGQGAAATSAAGPDGVPGTPASASAAPPRIPPREHGAGRWDGKARAWMQRLGPPALLLSWLPLVGDPLCAAAGWLRLPFWPCVVYMAIGKFARYVTMTYFLLWAAKGW